MTGDAANVDIGDGGSNCVSVCTNGLPNVEGIAVSCSPKTGDAGDPEIDCVYEEHCTGGRMTSGVVPEKEFAQGSAAGLYFARMAYLEDASVIAFRRLRADLTKLGAPSHLVGSARSAEQDEIRHARMVGSLARRYGVEPVRAMEETQPALTLEALAMENAMEGCVRETYGAAAVTWQAQHARDPQLKSVAARIAVDETRHAELAWAIAAWADTRLSSAARLEVARARRNAADELSLSLADEPTPESLDVGIPPASVALTILDAMRRDLAV